MKTFYIASSSTPFGRQVTKSLAEAFKRQGLRWSFDWPAVGIPNSDCEHPDVPHIMTRDIMASRSCDFFVLLLYSGIDTRMAYAEYGARLTTEDSSKVRHVVLNGEVCHPMFHFPGTKIWSTTEKLIDGLFSEE